jgi:HD-GYP domain-containing protein (c-di-GMP phosphodiesterase class II)
VFSLTVNESKRFTEHIDAVGPEHVAVLETQAKEFLKGDFISLRLYGVGKKKILEAFDPDGEVPRRGLPEHVHDLAPGEFDHHHMSWVDGRLLMQVLLPVAGNDGVMHGYFEGVYAVNASTLGDIKAGMTAGLALTLGIVLVTAAVLYSVIAALNQSLISLSADLLKSNIELMEVLGSAIALRDSVTDVHNYRVTAYAMEMGKALRLPARQVRDLVAGAFLHDAGKIGISDTILLKPGPLTSTEMESMRRHVSLGVSIVANSGWLRGAREVVEFHHEKFDGSGYLKGLAGEAIPHGARIFAIIDVFDALVSRRPYKDPLPFDDAVAILERGRGTHFDPALLDVFRNIAAETHGQITACDDAALRRIVRSQVAQYFLLADEAAHG